MHEVHVKAYLMNLEGADQQAVQVMIRGTGRIYKQHAGALLMTFNGQLGVSELQGRLIDVLLVWCRSAYFGEEGARPIFTAENMAPHWPRTSTFALSSQATL